MFGLLETAPILLCFYIFWFSTFLNINSVVRFKLIGSSLASNARRNASSIFFFWFVWSSNKLITYFKCLFESSFEFYSDAISLFPILILITNLTFSMRFTKDYNNLSLVSIRFYWPLAAKSLVSNLLRNYLIQTLSYCITFYLLLNCSKAT